jgi:CRP/FNR family transcriptional regulator, dissimilatory nitrate respiration regulator
MTESAPLKQLLARTELCSGLAPETLAGLAARARRLRAGPGQFLINAGQREAPLHLIIDGGVRLAVPNIAGIEKTIATLNDGKAFGLAEYFAGRAYRYYAVAQRDSLLITLPGAVVEAMAETEPALMRNLLAALGRQFDALAHDIENSNRYNASQRVVNLLLRQASRASDGTVRTRLPQKKAITASRLGLAPETFSRCLAALTERKLISVEHRTIVIHDIGAMQAMLDPE